MSGGMYNMVFGVHPLAGGLMDLILNLSPQAVPRFRDCYPVQYGKEDRKIEMVTRAGGDNAAEYTDEIAALEKHPLYLDSQDDPYDSTYRVFWFRLPTEEENERMEELNRLLEKHPSAVFTTTLAERWKEVIKAMQGEPAAPKIILTGGESS